MNEIALVILEKDLEYVTRCGDTIRKNGGIDRPSFEKIDELSTNECKVGLMRRGDPKSFVPIPAYIPEYINGDKRLKSHCFVVERLLEIAKEHF
jgi:hypothetical protein